VGFRKLYAQAHIPGSEYVGAAGEDAGLQLLRERAATLSKDTAIVIYCGCCPMEKCPNIRPAFKALRALGFQTLRVLLLPQDFATDWVGKGLPYDKGD